MAQTTASPASSSTSPPLRTPWTNSNGISASYELHCHCGAVKHTITLSPPLYKEQTEGKERWTAIECNCSHCERVGAINVHPFAKDVKFTQGRENVVEYRCGAKKNPHLNCKLCGCFLATDLSAIMESIGQENRMAINLRMLKDFDREKLFVRQDTAWKDMPPKYEV